MLLRDSTAMMQWDFVLTDAEMVEAELFFSILSSEDFAALEPEALETKNIGIQHLIVWSGRLVLLENLARNVNLLPDVVSLIVNYSERKHPVAHNPLYILKDNQVIFSDFILFEQVFTSLFKKNNSSRNVLLSRAFSDCVAGEKNGTLSVQRIKILLCLMGYVNEHAGKIYTPVVSFSEKCARRYSQGIKSFIAQTMPDLTNLPLSWVLKAGNFYEEEWDQAK